MAASASERTIRTSVVVVLKGKRAVGWVWRGVCGGSGRVVVGGGWVCSAARTR